MQPAATAGPILRVPIAAGKFQQGDEVARADRLAHHQHPRGAVTGHLEVAVDPQRLAREPAEELGGIGDLRLRLGNGLAHLEGHQQREPVGALAQQLECASQISPRSSGTSPPNRPAPRRRRRLRPGRPLVWRRRSRRWPRRSTGPRPASVALPAASRHSPPIRSCLRRVHDRALPALQCSFPPPDRQSGQRSGRPAATDPVRTPHAVGSRGTEAMRLGKRTLMLVPRPRSRAAAAHAAWMIEGHGLGHGVGLSQYGAYGFACQPPTARSRYRGTDLRRVKGERVRVLLGSGRGSVGFSGTRRACGKRIRSSRRYSLAAEAGGVVLRGRDGDRIKACAPLGNAGAGVRIGGRARYRGSLVARNAGARCRSSMCSGFRATSRAWSRARCRPRGPSRRRCAPRRSSPALLATVRRGAFDHYADTRSQVYGAGQRETKATNRPSPRPRTGSSPIAASRRSAYYFSSSGGRTESSEFARGGDAGPLPAVGQRPL